MKHNGVLLLLILAVSMISCRSAAGDEYPHRILTTDGELVGIGDPFVYKYGDVYYLTGTTAVDEGFDYYTSKDLREWKFCGPLYRKGEGHYGATAFWAPEVKYYKGRFYLTYSALDPGKGRLLTSLAVSDNPQGPFEDIHAPWFDLGFSAIDGHIFVDDDAGMTPYLYFSRNGVEDGYGYGINYVVELLADLSGFAGDPVFVGDASQEWEKVNYDVNRCNEGVFVIKNNGKYYMTYSANDTGFGNYGVGTAVANHPFGPWIKDPENPILSTDHEAKLSSPGHNSIVESPDGQGLLIVYHSHREYGCEMPSHDRVVSIDRLYFDSAGNLRVGRE